MSITDNALALVPEYQNHINAGERIRAEIIANRSAHFDAPITEHDLVDCALAGDEIPRDIWEHNEGIRKKKINSDVRNRMLNEALKQLEFRKEQCIRSNSQAALNFVRAELDALMEDVRKIQLTLGSIRTAEQVLATADTRTTTAWQETTALSARYDDLRAAQRILTLPTLGREYANKLTAVGHIRNSVDQADYWLNARRRAASHRSSIDGHEGVLNYRTWLRTGVPNVRTGREGSWEYLKWLATHAEPWVPTPGQIEEAFEAAKIAVAPALVSSLAAQEKARDRYFDIVGAAPLTPYTRTPKSAQSERHIKTNITPRGVRASLIE